MYKRLFKTFTKIKRAGELVAKDIPVILGMSVKVFIGEALKDFRSTVVGSELLT